MSYQTDNLETLYNEIQHLESELYTVGRNIKFLSEAAATDRARYEEKKNIELIAMFDEEKTDKSIKRTEPHRTAIYRTKFADYRLKANLSEQNLKAERDYLDGLQSKLSGLQTRVRILEVDQKLSTSKWKA